MGEFEQYRATLSDYELLRSANCCRHAFEYQQSKIEQLEKEKALQELEINQVSQANQEWQRLNFEKEKRISDALKILGGASPTMLDKKAIRILRGECG